MIAARLALFFAAYFWVAGVGMSYWPVWLQYRGVDTVETGTIFMARQIVTVLAILAVGMLVSRRSSLRGPLLLLVIGASVMALAYEWAWGFWPNLVVTLIWGILWHPILSLGEGVSVSVTRQRQVDYSRVRLWGSVSFILGAIAVGAAVEAWGAAWVLYVMWLGVGLCVPALLLLPRPVAEDRGTAVRENAGSLVRALMRHPAFLLFLLAAGCCQASHAVLGLIGTLTWRAAGISDATISLLWTASIVAEIVLFLFGSALARVCGASGLLALGATAGLVRWLAMPFAESFPAIVLLQALHAFTFGATHLGAMAFLQRSLSLRQMPIGQSLYHALASGLLSAAMYQLGGWLFSRFALDAYFAMAGLCALSLIAAILLGRIWNGTALVERAGR